MLYEFPALLVTCKLVCIPENKFISGNAGIANLPCVYLVGRCRCLGKQTGLSYYDVVVLNMLKLKVKLFLIRGAPVFSVKAQTCD